MSMILTVGYRRDANGSAVPVCDPPSDAYLLFLWRHAVTVTLRTERCVAIGTLDGTVVEEGRMDPEQLSDFIRDQLSSVIAMMSFVNGRIAQQYPIAMITRHVSKQAGNLLYAFPERSFVETEPPAHVTNGCVRVTEPRIAYADGRARLIITGTDRDFPYWQWADAVLRAHVEEAVLAHVAKTNAPES